MPGLAHFCEHLLFMVRIMSPFFNAYFEEFQGTEQFPIENDYNQVQVVLILGI